MSYEPTNWKSGDKVASTKLNKIEQGIVNNENEVSQLKEDLNVVSNELGATQITLPNPTNGYWTGDVGDTISFTSATNSRAYQIDLSSYIGKKVNVKIQSGGTTSSRRTAICTNGGVIGEVISETDLVASPKGILFNVTSEYNQLYVSAYANGAGGYTVEVEIISSLSLEVLEISSHLHRDVAYVDASVESSGDGSSTSPYKTIQEGINSGAVTVKVKAGTYGAFKVLNRDYKLVIELDKMPNYQSNPQNDVQKIKITSTTGATGYGGVQISNCSEVVLSDMWVDGVPRYGYGITDVQSLEMIRCYASSNNTSNFSLFRLVNVNGVIRDCKAWDSMLDGFNIHGYGNTQFINCVAYDCDDDGISHHDACTGLIFGGEYYRCGKGGVSSPTYGSSVDISGVYSHDNTQYGIYADGGEPSSYPQKVKARISNCVLKNNGTVDIYTKNSELVGWNNIYDTKNIVTEKGGAFTEYS